MPPLKVTAARAFKDKTITIVDSRSASLGLGMLALRAVELAEAGWKVNAIGQELTAIRDRSGGFFTVDTFENLLRSGRVTRGRAWLGGPDDCVRVPASRPRPERDPGERPERLTPRPQSFRLAIVHAGIPEIAAEIRETLIRRFGPRDCFLSEVTAAMGVHVGLGAWAIFYQIEDPTPLNAGDPFANRTAS